MNEINLAIAREFLINRAPHNSLLKWRDDCLNRKTILRRRLNHAQVSHAHQRHVQRPRNRSRRKTKNVHVLAQLLNPLFVRDSEPLFLVHDQQTQIVKLNVFGKQPVRSRQPNPPYPIQSPQSKLFCSAAVRNRLNISIFVGNAANLLFNVS